MGEYSVETKNRFQLILDSDDEGVDVYDILREKETKPVSKNADPEIKNTKNAKLNEKKDKSKKPGQKVDNANVANIQKTQNKTAPKGNGETTRRCRLPSSSFDLVTTTS